MSSNKLMSQFDENRRPASVERVKRGAAWLDKNHPGWEYKIDLSILDISDPQSCICGQVLPGGFLEALMHFHDRNKSAGHFGFSISSDGDTWVRFIKDRFDSGNLSA